jgi:hypothetical protein
MERADVVRELRNTGLISLVKNSSRGKRSVLNDGH